MEEASWGRIQTFGDEVPTTYSELGWTREKKKGELDTRPPPSLVYSDDDCEIVGQKKPTDDINNNALEA